jgi:hypothetical protein
MLKEKANLAGQFADGQAGCVGAGHADCAALRAEQPIEVFDQGALARTVGADKGHELALGDG